MDSLPLDAVVDAAQNLWRRAQAQSGMAQP